MLPGTEVDEGAPPRPSPRARWCTLNSFNAEIEPAAALSSLLAPGSEIWTEPDDREAGDVDFVRGTQPGSGSPWLAFDFVITLCGVERA